MSSRTIPAFASESEEAAWWYENREKHDEEFEQAFAEGRVRRGSIAQRLMSAQEATTIRLAEQDALTAATLAAKKGMPVQEYVAGLLHHALEKELENAA